MMQHIFQDWDINKGNTKAQIILVLFRTAQFLRKFKIFKIITWPYFLFYKIFIECILGIELRWKTKIGRNLSIHHGQSLVVNQHSIIGHNCTLRHSTTIGNKLTTNDCPTIGNNVDIGSNVCIIGNIRIGDNVVIGCGSVVVKDVPSNSTVVGNPSYIIRQNGLKVKIKL